MSCFIVERGNIAASVCALSLVDMSPLGIFLLSRDHGLNLDGANTLGNRLWALNHAAWQGRYPDQEKIPVPEFHWSVPDNKLWDRLHLYAGQNKVPANMFAPVVKRLTVLIYQCAEEPVDRLPEFAELERLEGLLCKRIVQDLPAWDQAPWS